MNSPPKKVTDAFYDFKDAVDGWDRKLEAIKCAMVDANVKADFEILQVGLYDGYNEVDKCFNIAEEFIVSFRHPNKKKMSNDIRESLIRVGNEFFSTSLIVKSRIVSKCSEEVKDYSKKETWKALFEDCSSEELSINNETVKDEFSPENENGEQENAGSEKDESVKEESGQDYSCKEAPEDPQKENEIEKFQDLESENKDDNLQENFFE